MWGQSYCKLTVLHVCGASHVWTVYKKFTVWVYECIYSMCVCVASQSAWLSECNGSALMDAHLKWSVQSVAEVQPSLASSPAWKPYYLLSIILALFFFPLHFPHFSLRVFLSPSLYQFTIFIPCSLTEPATPVSTGSLLNLFILVLRMKTHGSALLLAVLWTFYVVPPSPAVQWREWNKGRWHVTTSSLDLYQAPVPEAVWMRH